MRRWYGSLPRSVTADPGRRTCRSTSTCCSASRPWRCAGRGATTWSRSARRRWQHRLVGDERPAVYAHVATDPERAGKLALQYWFFYVFNDWNNLHEGDWEMIQLVFEASTPAQALQR